MKKIFVSMLAVAALASCSNEETIIAQSREAINFNDAFIENAVRSIDPSITTATITSFKVYGTTQGDEQDAPVVNIYNGVDVTKASIDGGVGDVDTWWYSANAIQYWIAGNKYNFAAVVNGNVTTDATGMPATIAYTADGVTDLLYASAENITGEAAGNDPVNFTFDHLLSKVKFTVTNTMTTNVANNLYEYVVTGIAVNNAYTTGTYTLATKAWSDQATTMVVNFGNVEAVGVVGASESASSDYERLLIPATYGQGSELNVTFTLTTLLNGKSVNVENITLTPKVTFEAGKAYNFVVEKGAPGEEIKFTVTAVNGWVNGTI